MMTRDVCLEGLQDIIDIERENFSAEETASLNDTKEHILTIPDVFLVAKIDGKICDYVEGPATRQHYLTDDLSHQVVSNPANDGSIAVTNLSVAPNFKGQGIGMALLTTIKDLVIAQGWTGITLTCHENLISYYERSGSSDEGELGSTHGGPSQYNTVWGSPMIEW